MIQLQRAMFPFSIGKLKQLGPAVNGYNTVSAFPGKGKKTAWQVINIKLNYYAISSKYTPIVR
jgi:hypothetical protein